MKQDIQTDKLALAFELADDKQIAAFAKEYAQADDSFAEYIVEKILPASPIDEDLYEEIDSIFDANSGSYGKRYKPYFDWHEIGQATWRFIKKLKTMLGTDNELTACYCSIHLLQRICEMYIEDEVWNDQDFDGDDFGADEALGIIVKVLSVDDLGLDYKLEIIEDVRDIAVSEACTGYGIGDFLKFERLARKITMGAEDYLADLQQRIAKSWDDSQKVQLLEDAVGYLDSLGRKKEANSLIADNIKYPAMRQYVIDELLEKKQYNEVVKTIDEGFARKDSFELYEYRRKWLKTKLSACKELKDKRGEVEAAKQLFINDYKDEKNLHRLKELIPKTEWHNEFALILKECHVGIDDSLYTIAISEGMQDCLASIMINDWMLVGSYDSHLRFMSHLSESDQKLVCEHVANKLRQQAVGMGRDNYSRVRYAISQLKESCSLGAEYCKLLIEEFRETYPKRRAMLEELDRLT